MPMLAKFIAIPPPIVPAPMMPTLPIGNSGVSTGTSAMTFAASSALVT